MAEAKTTKDALDKPKKGDDKAKKNTGFFKGIQSEFKKIMWPTFENLMKQSWTVIVVSAILGFVIMFIDLIYSYGYNLLITG